MVSPVYGRGGWYPIRVHEPFAGAWQRNLEGNYQDVLAFPTLWACITLIANDVSKLWVNLVEKDDNGIWSETESTAFSPVLRKPNRYQTRIKFFQRWILSKLIHGNTYVLKERDQRGIVVAMYILDPSRCKPLVAPDGSVYYQLSQDNLSGIREVRVVVPASEIIHDIMYPLFHDLVGVSPIYACGMAALQGLRIQDHSTDFFANSAQPSGVLTAPGAIDQETAARLQRDWETQFTGQNVGKVAVLGNGLTFEPMTITAEDAQLIEQLKWNGITICSCFHVPPWKVGIEPDPPYGNIQAGNVEYYSRALQELIESLELCLDEGLELPRSPRQLGVEFDLDALLRMDTAMQMDITSKGVEKAIFSPNEARERFALKPVEGGESPMLQQQMFSLEALRERDQDQPFSKPQAGATATPAITAGEAEEKSIDPTSRLVDAIYREWVLAA